MQWTGLQARLGLGTASPLEAPVRPAAHKKIMLATFSCVRQRKIRLPGPKVANLPSNVDPLRQFHIQPEAKLQNSGGRRFPRITPSINQSATLAEMSETRSHAHPGRYRRRG